MVEYFYLVSSLNLQLPIVCSLGNGTSDAAVFRYKGGYDIWLENFQKIDKPCRRSLLSSLHTFPWLLQILLVQGPRPWSLSSWPSNGGNRYRGRKLFSKQTFYQDCWFKRYLKDHFARSRGWFSQTLTRFAIYWNLTLSTFNRFLFASSDHFVYMYKTTILFNLSE